MNLNMIHSIIACIERFMRRVFSFNLRRSLAAPKRKISNKNIEEQYNIELWVQSILSGVYIATESQENKRFFFLFLLQKSQRRSVFERIYSSSAAQSMTHRIKIANHILQFNKIIKNCENKFCDCISSCCVPHCDHHTQPTTAHILHIYFN